MNDNSIFHDMFKAKKTEGFFTILIKKMYVKMNLNLENFSG